jgi:hypothetical protein
MRFHSRCGVWFLVVAGFPALLRGQSPKPPPLGAAASFAVLGGSSVRSSGPTIVTGNLGVSPGNTVTGFPPGTVKVGDTFHNDATAHTAQHDAAAAYNYLASRTPCTVIGPNVGGLTLTRGVYCLSSPAQLTGTLTLNAEGDPTAVWIFQIAGTFTTDAGSHVLTIKGSQAGNVFWQVGNSASLGANSTFLGNLLALTSIALNNGASVSGRLLARTGDVTLDTNNASLCCDPINLEPPALPDGWVGKAYNQTFTASGGLAPYIFTIIAGSLPPGFNPLTPGGVLSGTPAKPGTFPFTVMATDFHGCTGTRDYTIVIPCQTITVTNPATTMGTSCTPFSQQFMQTGAIGGATFSFTGKLPAGLMLSRAGLLSGTPTQTGPFPITVGVTDGNGCTSAGPIYNLIITCPTIVVTNPATTKGTAGMSFSQTFTQTGSLCATTFSLDTGMLPTGLTLATNGELFGTPTQTGTFIITVKATDRIGCVGTGLPYTLVICCQTIIVRSPVNAIGTVGVPFSETFTQRGAIGGATFTTSGPLPTGAPPVTLATNGTLSGTPTQSGSFTVTVKVTDGNGCTGIGVPYPLVINPAACVLTLSPATLPSTSLGVPYSETITASGGTAPYTFSVSSGALPPGLALNTTTGEISGTPTTIGAFNFCIMATDAKLCTGGPQCYTIVVVGAVGAVGGPTLSAWGMIVLSMLLVGAGWVMMRRVAS